MAPNLHGRVKRERWKLQGSEYRKNSAKVERDDNGARLNISMSTGSRIVFGTKDKDWLDLLWEAGLQVTIQGLCSGPKGTLLARNVQSEAIKALGHPALSDSFVSFAKTAIGVDKVKDGEDLGLCFNGTSYNAAMHKAALSLGALFPSCQQRVFQAVQVDCGDKAVHSPKSRFNEYKHFGWQSFLAGGDAVSGFQAESTSSIQQIHGWIETEKLVLQDSGLLACLFWRQEKGKEIQWTFLPLNLNF